MNRYYLSGFTTQKTDTLYPFFLSLLSYQFLFVALTIP